MLFNEEDVEAEPLVRSQQTTNGHSTEDESSSIVGGTSASSKESSFVRRNAAWISALLVFAIGALAILYKQDIAFFPVEAESKQGAIVVRQADCPRFCKAQNKQRSVKWGGVDLQDTSDMLRRALEEKEKTVSLLKVQYGEEFYPKLFLDENGTSVGRTAFVSANEETQGDVSRKRFIRKLMMKVLSVQLAVEQEKKNSRGCDCSATGKRRILQGVAPGNPTTTPNNAGLPLADHYARMVWANGGHSAAAGHGNFYNESYTAVVERMAKNVFAAVGIELEGRNYAFGAMSSAPELALCQEAVFGTDADVLTWNFGMTDGKDFWRNHLYGNRRGVHRNRPLLLDIDVGSQSWATKGRMQVLQKLEQSGLPVMYSKMDLWMFSSLRKYFPDIQTMTEAEINAIPEFLRHFKCGEQLEMGDPTCAKNKYTDTVCANRHHKASWHPGWKAHALSGNIMAFFMIEALIDALKELDALLKPPTSGQPVDPTKVLSQLQSQEDEDYQRFLNSTVPNSLLEEDLAKENEVLFRGRAVCHTALRPAETRYLGILTETEDSSFDSFEYGMKRSDADNRNQTEGEGKMQLTYDMKREDCPILTFVDFKDYFLVKHEDGEASLTLPNEAEREAYLGNYKLQGIIAVCYPKCGWNKCPPGDLQWENINSGNVTMSVNGDPVMEAKWLNGCALLRGEHGYFWKANTEGKYDLKAKVNFPGGYIRLTSVILL